MRNFLTTAALATGLIIPLSVASIPANAEDHKNQSYHDAKHNDEHHWDSHEDRAYRMWVKENHRKYRNFGKLKDEERETYWGWRHDHPDSLLKIDIR